VFLVLTFSIRERKLRTEITGDSLHAYFGAFSTNSVGEFSFLATAIRTDVSDNIIVSFGAVMYETIRFRRAELLERKKERTSRGPSAGEIKRNAPKENRIVVRSRVRRVTATRLPVEAYTYYYYYYYYSYGGNSLKIV